MTLSSRIAWLSIMAVTVVGCAGPQRAPAPVANRQTGPVVVRPAPAPAPPPQPEGTIIRPLPDSRVVAQPLPEIGAGTGQPLSPPPTPAATEQASPAVVALLDTAGRQSQSGEHSRAGATLERAIKIEPRNAMLWHRLALTRLGQGQLDQAAILARKSNTFAGSDRRLRSDNWLLIAEVLKRKGDPVGAKQAMARAAEQ